MSRQGPRDQEFTSGAAHVTTAGAPTSVSHRVAIVDDAMTPADNTAVAVGDLLTYTNISAGIRNIRVKFIPDPSNVGNGPSGVAFTINAYGDGDAASKLSVTEGDADDSCWRIARTGDASVETLRDLDADITRVDIVGILPGGTPAYAIDLVQVEMW